MLGSAKTNWPLLTLTSSVKGTSSFGKYEIYHPNFPNTKYSLKLWSRQIMFSTKIPSSDLAKMTVNTGLQDTIIFCMPGIVAYWLFNTKCYSAQWKLPKGICCKAKKPTVTCNGKWKRHLACSSGYYILRPPTYLIHNPHMFIPAKNIFYPGRHHILIV